VLSALVGSNEDVLPALNDCFNKSGIPKSCCVDIDAVLCPGRPYGSDL
jgi:hypothetical protein